MEVTEKKTIYFPQYETHSDDQSEIVWKINIIYGSGGVRNMSGGIPVSQDYKSDLLLIKKNHFPWFRWLVRFTLYSKHRKNCECCPGHYLSTSVY